MLQAIQGSGQGRHGSHHSLPRGGVPRWGNLVGRASRTGSSPGFQVVHIVVQPFEDDIDVMLDVVIADIYVVPGRGHPCLGFVDDALEGCCCGSVVGGACLFGGSFEGLLGGGLFPRRVSPVSSCCLLYFKVT